ncbi:MAG: hypothetical protein JNL11_11590 [Bdellovibrionaceae bacterium]|nr:hypothetical protein [Pseudobdellovibrionaceae bacterium]
MYIFSTLSPISFRQLLVSSLLVLGSIGAYAGNIQNPVGFFCGEEVKENTEIEKYFSKIELIDGATETDREQVFVIGSCVQSLLSGFPTPDGTTMKIVKNGTGGSVDVYQNMTLPIPYAPKRRKQPTLTETYAVLAHEWAHLFHREKQLPGLAKLGSNLESQPSVIKKMFWSYNSGENFDRIKPYLELFADTVAVVMFDDLKIMSSANDSGVSRDFNYQRNCKSIHADDLHGYFDPTRFEIGKFYKKSIRTARERTRFLWGFSQIIDQQIDLTNDPYDPFYGKSLCEKNKILILKFLEYFSDPIALQ